MKSTHEALVQFWIDIGKVKRCQHPANPKKYIDYFVREDGIELEIKGWWEAFFKYFNTSNFHYFLGHRIQVYDPWKDVDAIEIVANFNRMFPGEGLRKQKFKGIEKL